ncbi:MULTISPECIES: flagellar biosynthetic protein FliO [Sphingobium]|jgi:flagellar protein FliO/FliZ|uniref:FliO/MopB family protein n=1 Tax=Sphingobium fuliginis (strain ATCC 27551) TaxID=336203 RepID=A0A4Q4J4P7_SPHSA|nr:MULTISPECIES: flagellar biosynthetic protein FliO [Sphingobium]AJR22800.1 flagellar biogenesis protein FliO [Sphingobium sp. YBL2]MCB4859054.1 flagellar biosynthetic protein FliO [Sphingobium sp. PNB]PNQ01618.1 flagellar biogenesis protein FliO [Sphingobium sp. SA916]QOT70763.1 FliO/MopB family protein [Sphingobium fuliginis]RYM01162.1 flagellar biogenesis protein FliO [Sphingobium fuliginis]
MIWYFVKLLILLPLVGGMAFGALWLWRKYQPGMMAGQNDRSLKVLEALPMGTFGKLAVVEFEGKKILLSVTRGRIEKIAEGDPYRAGR